MKDKLLIPVLLLSVVVARSLRAQETGSAPDEPMYRQPYIAPQKVVKVFDARLLPLWTEAMSRPDADTRMQAAGVIGLAHRRGMPGLEAVAGRLTKMLDDDPSPLVRLAAAGSLIELDARSAAAAMLDRNQKDGQDMALLTDPALARWAYEPAGPVWLARLTDPATPRALRASAIDALGVAHDAAAEPALLHIALDRGADASIRLAAARALAGVAGAGLERDARALAGPSEPLPDRLVAAAMLGGHAGGEAERLLIALAGDAEPAVAGIALRRLVQLDPKAEQIDADALSRSADSNLRALAAQILTNRGTLQAVASLGRMMDDPIPALRADATVRLAALHADAALADAVVQQDRDAMAGATAHVREQGALLAGRIDDKAAGDILVGLMAAPEPAVRMAALGALQRLAAPATLPAMLLRAQAIDNIIKQPKASQTFAPGELRSLMETMGLMQYAPAEPLLRTYVPKTATYGADARPAAVWALGRIHQDAPAADLVGQFIGRMNDTDGPMAESNDVRRMAAIALGLMKAKAAQPALEARLKEESMNADMAGCCRWALERITGREIPPVSVPAATSKVTGWFLEPIDP